MVNIQAARQANAAYFKDRPLTAVVVGAASGIGEYSVRALCKLYSTTTVPLHIYLVGRNEQAVAQITAECLNICPHAELTFIRAGDLSCIRDVDEATAKIIELESTATSPRIDMLVQCQGKLNFYDRNESPEGLESSLSLVSYSRFRFILNLMSLLEAAPNPHVVSVYAAGKEGSLFEDDWGLRQNYSFFNARSHGVIMTTLFFEKMASEHPKVAFVHNFPSVVVTPGYYQSTNPWWFKVLWGVFGPIVQVFLSTSPVDSGTRTLNLGTDRYSSADHTDTAYAKILGTDGRLNSGAYSINEYGEPCALEFDYATLRKNGIIDKFWQHLTKVFGDIEKTGKTLA